jgi:hypothetical protein
MSGINRFRRTLGCAALAALALAGTATWGHAANQAGSHVMTMKQDLANREKDMHWPQGFDPSHADLFSHNELLINAPCERIWSHIIDATKWPEWYPNSKEVKITGDTVLKDGSVFRWTTFGLPLESKVNEFTPAAGKLYFLREVDLGRAAKPSAFIDRSHFGRSPYFADETREQG